MPAATGKVGVCFATSGPGATNLTTGIATAYMDSSPVVFISCNVAQSLIGKDAFQEVDITGITMPITKFTYMVRDVEKLADVVRDSFALARSGRPGPVFIDITRDVTAAECDYEPLPLEQHATTGHLASLLSPRLHQQPEDARGGSRRREHPRRDDRPVGKADAHLRRRRGAQPRARGVPRLCPTGSTPPCAITVMGGGGVAGRDPLATGMIGMHGSVASNMAVDNCDLLIAVGCRFSDRVALKPDTFARQARIVHIDIDRAEINKNVQTDHHIIGDAKRVLQPAATSGVPQYDHTAWKDYVFSFPTETGYHRDAQLPHAEAGALQPSRAAARRMPSSQPTSASTRCGRSSTCHFDYPGQLLTSGGFGTMGFGLGAAIGAKLRQPRQDRHPHHRRRLLPHELQ